MKKILITTVTIAIASTSVFLAVRDHNRPAYQKSRLPIETRVNDLLSRMTLNEKIGQMVLVDKNSVPHIPDVGIYGIGGILSGGGGKPKNNTPQGWRDMVAEYTKASRTSRLGIPILYGVDAVHGHGNVPGATIFPHAINLGATNDPTLVKKIAHATAEEMKATGIMWSFSPNLDAPEDIRWGRVYEAFSSDASVNALLGSAYIEGLQGKTQNDTQVLATAKHYLGVGGMKWGTAGNKTYTIDQGATLADESILHAYYLPPFKAAVDAGVLSIMVGLNSFGDQKMSANTYLLTDVLKKEFGFQGFVVSDWFGIYGIPGGDYHATVTAINAGIDMAMLPFDYALFMENMTKAVEKDDIPMSRIDDAVRRILRAKFAVGVFEKKSIDSLRAIGSKKHRALAREAVSASLVLLKNENQVLPISLDAKRIFVAGSAADNTGRQSGGWTIEWQGVDGNALPGATSILEGIQHGAGSDTTVIYDAQANFVADTNMADIGIAIVGEKPYAEGVGDTANPTLSPEDLTAIASLRNVSKKLVVIIVSGRPLVLPESSHEWDALVAAWLPGSEGGGVADVLFGKQPFTGKLPLPWPKNLKQLPFTLNGTSHDGTEPLFPLGFGIR